jgi:hypothetical protein
VAADAIGLVVGVDDHRGGVPAGERAEASLEDEVTRVWRFVLGRDRVDVGSRERAGRTHVSTVGLLLELGEQVPGPVATFAVDHGTERQQPLVRLPGIRVGELPDEPVDRHERSSSTVFRTSLRSATVFGPGPSGPRGEGTAPQEPDAAPVPRQVDDVQAVVVQ